MADVNNTNNQDTAAEVVGFKRAVPIILFAAAAFIALCFITQGTGWLGNFISKLFLGLFSYGAYAIPLLLVIHGAFYIRDIENKCVLSRAIFSLITVITISALSYTIYYFGEDVSFAIADYYRLGIEGVGGGFIGSVLSFLLMKIFGEVGMIVIAVAIFALYISFFFAKSKRLSGKFLYFLLAMLMGLCALIEKGVKKIVAAIRAARQRKKEAEIQIKNEEFFGDDFFAVDNGLQELKIAELGIRETRSHDSIEANPTLHEKVFHKSAVEDEPYTYTTENDEPEFTEPVTERKKKTVSFYGVSEEEMRESATVKDRPEDIIIEEPIKETSSTAERNKKYGLDGNAEDVFTSDFNPFDFVAAEALSQKRSSKAVTLEKDRGVANIEESISKESISNITEEDINRARQLADFENKKRSAMEYMRRTATPVTSSDEVTGESKSVEINVAKSEVVVENRPSAGAYSVTIDKTDAYASKETQPAEQEAYSPKSQPIEEANYEPKANYQPAEEANYEPKAEYKSAEEAIYEPKAEYQPTVAESNTTFSYSDSYSYGSQTNADGEGEAPYADNASDDTVADSTPEENFSTPAYASENDEFAIDENYDEGEAEVYDSDTNGGIFEIIPEDDTPVNDAPQDTSIFEPIDYADTEDDKADESALFQPYTEPSADNMTTIEQLKPNEPDVLVTERSMINPILADEDDDEDATVEADYKEEGADTDPEIIPESERNPEIDEMRKMFPFLDSQKESEEGEENGDEPPFEGYNAVSTAPTLASAATTVQTAVVPVKEEPAAPKAPDFSNYVMPSIDLLTKDDAPNESSDEEVQENANKLIETLASFNVTVTIKGYDRGPRITRYEVVPAAGVKVTQVTNLENDVALALAADGLRVEAPIPGKSAIGFEIPNKHSETVRLRDLIETDEFATSSKPTTVCIGKDIAGFPVINSIEKMPHVLIAGATGMGKSVCINALMISMIYKSSPADIRFIMIDPKKVEFNMYNGIPHLLVPIVTDSKQAAGALMWAVDEMERRYDLIGKANVRNIDAYNEKIERKPELGNKLPRIVIVIDEFADLMLQVKDPVENLVMSLAQKARAAGIHLIIGTQRPSVNVLTGVIKANIPTRISCRVASNVDSRTILEQAGAEKLLDKGDMLFYTPGMNKPIRAQGAFVSDNEVEEIMDFLKQGIDGPVYDSSVLEEINKAAQRCDKNASDDSDGGDGDRSSSGEGYLNDKQFLDAAEIAVNMGKISVSLLQIKMQIGFQKASRFINVMEDLGIVGPSNGQKPRDVMMDADEWHEKLARTRLD